MNEKKIHILSLLAALTSAVIFGMSFMFSKLALEVAQPTAHSTCRRVTFSCSTSTSIRMQHTGTTAMMVPATAEDVYRMP